MKTPTKETKHTLRHLARHAACEIVDGGQIVPCNADRDRVAAIIESVATAHHSELMEALRAIASLRMADNWYEIRKLVPMWRGVPQNNVGVFIEKAADILAKLAP